MWVHGMVWGAWHGTPGCSGMEDVMQDTLRGVGGMYHTECCMRCQAAGEECALQAVLCRMRGCRSGGGVEDAHHPTGQAGMLDVGCSTGSSGRKGRTCWVLLQPVPLLQLPPHGRPAQTALQGPSLGTAVGSPAGLALPHLLLLPTKLLRPSPGSVGTSCHPSCFMSPGPCQPSGCSVDATAHSPPPPP